MNQCYGETSCYFLCSSGRCMAHIRTTLSLFSGIAPEIMRGRCPPPCNSCMKKQIQKMMAIISRKYPREWSQIIKEQLG